MMRSRLSGWIYRTLLYILPRHLRRSHGQEMERLFVENFVIETRRIGGWGYVYVWLAAIWDVAATARAERIANVRRPAPENAHMSAKRFFVSPILSDLTYAIRGLVRNPGFTTIAAITLALGIGMNTAIFSVVNSVVIVPLAYEAPDRLVRIYGTLSSRNPNTRNVSAPDARDWNAQSTTFDEIAVIDWGSVDLTGIGEPEVVRAANVSANFFALLGSRPSMGRLFLPEDELEGNDRVAIVTDGF